MSTTEKVTPVILEAEVPETSVTREAFAKPTTRMQELMEKYAGQTGADMSVAEAKTLRPITTKTKVRTFEDLTPDEQRKVYQMISETDYMTSKGIQAFGSLKESSLTRNAEKIIGNYTAKDVDYLANPMTDLLAQIKTDTVLEDITKAVNVEEKPSRLSAFFSLFSLKKARKKLAKKLAEMQPLLKNINEIELYAKDQSSNLESDIEVYEEMGRETFAQLTNFELYHIALTLMIEDATTKLTELEAVEVPDLQQTHQMNQLREAIDRMRRRQQTIYSVKISTFQSIPQIGVLVRGDEILVEKFGEIMYLVLPMWKWQYAIAIGAIRQKEALTFQQKVREVTSQLLTGNAKLLHDNMIAAQGELYKTAVAVQDLVTVQEYIDDMLVKVKEVRQQASQEAVEGMKKMEEIEQKNRELLLKGYDA